MSGLLQMSARVQPPPSRTELRDMNADELLSSLIHEELWVVGGANDRGEIVTAETCARRNVFRAEIRRRLQLLDDLREELI